MLSKHVKATRLVESYLSKSGDDTEDYQRRLTNVMRVTGLASVLFAAAILVGVEIAKNRVLEKRYGRNNPTDE